MLQRLAIQNYAIIDQLQIDFSENLNIITGETGAGKSILMGALNLILGQRSDSSVLQDISRKCIVEGYFKVKDNNQVRRFLDDNDLDAEEDILVRREINANGKSRSFINDTPVTLGQLKELSLMLVDLHQQFDTLDLGEKDFQREVLDALADNGMLLQDLRKQYASYQVTRKRLDALLEQQQLANKELDYNKFLFEELEELALQENELEDIDAELKLLSNAESIKQQLVAIYAALKDSDEPLVQQLKSMQQKMQPLEAFHPSLEGLKDRMHSATIELMDIADELEQVESSIHYDPIRIQTINDRLSAGYMLLKKHGVNDTAALLRLQEELSGKLEQVLNIGHDIEKATKETEEQLAVCGAIAVKLSANRSKQIKPFTEKVNKLLAQVGMPNARIDVLLKAVSLSQYGTDDISFVFDANKSNRFEPLHKVASGGELSRLMLSIKSLVAKKLQLPTLIFDEIDTGISGEAARQVGIIMKDLSIMHQLIAITHQPQIAARASAHYFVYKDIVNDKISTSIRQLTNDERITAIAKMLSGEKPTAAALENAREMVSN